MSHSVAKLLLQHAHTPAEREEAVRKAIQLKMPLALIEEYLDWLDNLRMASGGANTREFDDQNGSGRIVAESIA